MSTFFNILSSAPSPPLSCVDIGGLCPDVPQNGLRFGCARMGALGCSKRSLT
ncbi:hypothetical protein HHE06_13650 [Helicobacter heilmannii]|nr:hypothetical protein HHE06_13650 [Helicobacter heilmannii]